MVSLWLLTKKNIKLLLRAKSSALIVVLAPLLIMLILGLSFNTSGKYGLNIGVSSSSLTEDVDTFIKTLQEEQFKVVTYEGTLEDCLDDLTSGFVHTCLALPDSFAIEGNNPKDITFHVDPSRVNLVWMIQETIKEKLDFQSEQLSEELAGSALARLANANTRIAEEQGKLAAAKEKDTTAAASVGILKGNLLALDFTIPDITDDKTALASFQETMTEKILKSRNAVEDAEDALDNSNISNNALEEELQNIKASLAGMESLLSGLAPETQEENQSNATAVDTLPQILSRLQADVDVSQARLSTAATAIQDNTATMDSIASSVQESAGAIAGVEAALREVSASLSEQKVTEAGVVANPLRITVERINAGKTYLNYLFPALMVLVIMFSSLLLGTTLVMMEKNSPAFTRNYFLPLRKVTFVLAIYCTNLLLIAVQLAIILGISAFFLPELIPLLGNVALILFLAGTIFTFLGMILGYIFVSEETAVLASISLGSLLLFMSGVILPLESMSSTIRDLTFFNPFVLAEKLVRDVFIFQTPLAAVWIDLLVLAGYAFVLFLVILIVESLLHEHLTHRFLRHHHKAHRQEQKKGGNDI